MYDQKTIRKIAEFWQNINIAGDNECWEWQGKKKVGGYGYFSINGIEKGAHRIAYALSKGEIQPGLCVCHTCDNPPCCNPNHLWLGTISDNTRDMIKKGRGKQVSDQNRIILKTIIDNPEITYQEIADQFNITRQRVQQIVKRAGIIRYENGQSTHVENDLIKNLDLSSFGKPKIIYTIKLKQY
jgi:hypothetical protein